MRDLPGPGTFLNLCSGTATYGKLKWSWGGGRDAGPGALNGVGGGGAGWGGALLTPVVSGTGTCLRSSGESTAPRGDACRLHLNCQSLRPKISLQKLPFFKHPSDQELHMPKILCFLN